MFVTDMGTDILSLNLRYAVSISTPSGHSRGVYASAIDTAAYWAVYCELGEDLGLVSIDLKIDYLAPMNHGKLIVKGQSIKIGKTICLAEATPPTKVTNGLPTVAPR